MKDFYNNDYAVNRGSKSLVYRSHTNQYEVSQEQYLAEQKEDTAEDFEYWREVSLSLHKEIYDADRKYAEKIVSLELIEDNLQFDLQLVKSIDGEANNSVDESLVIAKKVKHQLLSKLKKNQRRRFVLHYEHGLNYTEIARIENVSVESISKGIKKINKKFLKMYIEHIVDMNK